MLKIILPVILLLISNIFMTFAWYGHLKFKSSALIAVILISWGIAFFEYCFQVPANRIGYEVYNAYQLNDSGGYNSFCFCGILSTLSKRRAEVELFNRLYFYNPCRIFHI